jgi:release factor glutamine methyltransferase
VRTAPKLEYFGEVYRPSDDTWLLLEVFESGHVSGDLCVDLGCGSGILGIYALLSGRCRRVVFVDLHEDAVKTTSYNVVLNGVDVLSIVIQSDACYPLPIRRSSADIVLANPPYLPSQEGFQDITTNGGVEGYEKVLCFIRASTDVLKPRGRLYLVYSSLSKPEIIRSQLECLGYRVNRERSKSFFFESLIALEGVFSSES